MKKIVGISLFIFWAFVAAILTAGLVFYQNNKNSPAGNSILNSKTNDPAQEKQITLDATEVAKHNSTGNCWIIINSKVYNVTGYLRSHPGGAGTITLYCGKDATPAFQAQGHSSYANNLLSSYYVGDLNQSVGTAQVEQNIQNTNGTPPPINRRDDDEYEDD